MIDQAKAVAQQLREDFCTCIHGFKSRNLIDPQCQSCNSKDDRHNAADTIDTLLAEIKQLKQELVDNQKKWEHKYLLLRTDLARAQDFCRRIHSLGDDYK